jgi:alpha-tubulin suppressor-like RCC1 family protein
VQNVMVPQRVGAGLLAKRVTSACAGGSFTAVVTAEGQLWTCGTGQWGQLGQGGNALQHGRHSLLPVRVVLGGVQGERITQVACGSHHTVALAESGTVYSFGYNTAGQLGRPEVPVGYDGCSGVPGEMQHEALQQGLAVAVQAGGNRSAVVLADGRLITFGWGVGAVGGADREPPA